MDPLLDHEKRIRELERSLADLATRARDMRWGTWQPAYFGDGGTPGTFTYAARQGYYTRIGSLCIIQGVLQISAITVAPTGNMRISNLPLTVGSSINGGVFFSFIANFNYSVNAVELNGAIVAGGNTISLYEAFDNAAAVPVPSANFTNANCNLQFTGFYQV